MAYVGYKVKDNAQGQLLSSISSEASGITLATGHGANFPSLGEGEEFLATLVQYDGAGFAETNVVKRERIRVTSISGDTLTVIRGDESDTPQAFDEGDYIFLTIRAKSIGELQEEIERLEDEKLDASGELRAGLSNRKVIYTNGSGVEQELPLGANGTFLKSNGPANVPEFGNPPLDVAGQTENNDTPTDSDFLVWYKNGAGNRKRKAAATSSRHGLVELATGPETVAESDTGRAITPDGLASWGDVYGVEMFPGDAYTLLSAPTEKGHNGTSPVKQKQFTIGYSGTYKIAWEAGKSSMASGANANSQIYKNGSPIAGTLKTYGATTGYQSYAEDLYFDAGDTIELRCRRTSGAAATINVRNFAVKYDRRPRFIPNLGGNVDLD